MELTVAIQYLILGGLGGAISAIALAYIIWKKPIVLVKKRNIVQLKGFHVTLIEPESDSIWGSLGITQDRAKELNSAVMNTLLERDNTGDRWSQCMEKTTSVANHANEAAYVLYLIGHMSGHECEREAGGGLGGMLARIIAGQKGPGGSGLH